MNNNIRKKIDLANRNDIIDEMVIDSTETRQDVLFSVDHDGNINNKKEEIKINFIKNNNNGLIIIVIVIRNKKIILPNQEIEITIAIEKKK